MKSQYLQKNVRYPLFHKKRTVLEKEPKDKKTPPKRKTSCHESSIVKILNHLDCSKTEKGIQTVVKRKMTSQVLSLEMEEQKSRDLQTISSEPGLLAYYLAFKKLFLIIFQASYYLMENMFQLSMGTFSNRSVGMVCLLFEKKEEDYDLHFLETLMVLARNLIYMASSPGQFQRRIDTVGRKVTLHNEKKETIRKAFLRPGIQSRWEQTVKPCLQDEETAFFIQDQFQSAEEKLCYFDIREVVVSKLASQAFSNDLRKYASLQEIDQDMHLDFKFEFLLTEEFIFKRQEEQDRASNKKGGPSNCMIM